MYREPAIADGRGPPARRGWRRALDAGGADRGPRGAGRRGYGGGVVEGARRSLRERAGGSRARASDGASAAVAARPDARSTGRRDEQGPTALRLREGQRALDERRDARTERGGRYDEEAEGVLAGAARRRNASSSRMPPSRSWRTPQLFFRCFFELWTSDFGASFTPELREQEQRLTQLSRQGWTCELPSHFAFRILREGRKKVHGVLRWGRPSVGP